MRTRAVSLLTTLMFLTLLVTGCRHVPDEHTSLALDPGNDPGAPPLKVSLMWHHHSTGDALLKGGLREAITADNIDFYELNYHEGKVGDYVIGDHTDPVDFPKNFNTPEYFKVLSTWKLDVKQRPHHDLVMFKSCFPSSEITSDGMLADYKKWYESLLPTFSKHPEILFIAMSTPPLNRGETTPENAARARKWAKWVATEYGKDVKNVRVFDLFNALAILEGKPGENTLVPQWAAAKYDSHPHGGAGKAVARLFVPWLNRALRSAGVVK